MAPLPLSAEWYEFVTVAISNETANSSADEVGVVRGIAPTELVSSDDIACFREHVHKFLNRNKSPV